MAAVIDVTERNEWRLSFTLHRGMSGGCHSRYIEE